MREEADGTQVWSGEFHLADDESWRGELRYHPTSGIELRLTGHSTAPFDSFNQRDYPTLLGEVEGSQPVTLINCFDAGTRHYFSGFEERRIVVNHVVLGLAISNLTEPVFGGLSLKSPSITAWYVPANVRVKYSGRKKRNVTIRYVHVPLIKARLAGDTRLKIWSGLSHSMGLKSDGSVDFRVEAGVSLDFPKLRSWQEAIRACWALEIFFCLALGRLSGPPELYLIAGYQTRAERPQFLRVLNSQAWYRPLEAGHITDWTFTLPEIRANVGTVFIRWFELQATLGRILSLYIAALEIRGRVDTVFLLMAQAVEALHRETIGGEVLPKEDFDLIKESLIDVLPDGLPNDARELFLTRIGFMNEAGLTRRIKELCRLLPDRGEILFPHFAKDAGLAANYRNSLVHVAKGQKTVGDFANEVSYLGEFLRALFELSVLRLLGLSEQAFASIAKRNRRYNSLSRHRASVFGNST